jgi:quercetin dioxygenase-like cupin family protein
MPQMSNKLESTGQSKGKNAIHPWVNRAFVVLVVLVGVAIGVMSLAHHMGDDHVKSIDLSQRDIIEKLDGKSTSVTVREVTFEPGQKDTAHRHTGPVFGYVLEGEYEHAMDDEPVKIYKAGETFYEASGAVHRVAQNPSSTNRTRLLAMILHARDDKQVTIREKGNE